ARLVGGVLGEEALLAAGAAQGGEPFLLLADALARQERDAVADLEQARDVLGALDVARHPEQVVGGAAEHQGSGVRGQGSGVGLAAQPREQSVRHPANFGARREGGLYTLVRQRLHIDQQEENRLCLRQRPAGNGDELGAVLPCAAPAPRRCWQGPKPPRAVPPCWAKAECGDRHPQRGALPFATPPGRETTGRSTAAPLTPSP